MTSSKLIWDSDSNGLTVRRQVLQALKAHPPVERNLRMPLLLKRGLSILIALGLCGAGAQRMWSQAYFFSTLAGNAGYGSIDGPTNQARLDFPQGVAVDNAGNVYVADTQNSTIRKIDPNGVVTTLAGMPGAKGR